MLSRRALLPVPMDPACIAGGGRPPRGGRGLAVVRGGVAQPDRGQGTGKGQSEWGGGVDSVAG